uniref:Uncharacterized protein n=1 Tax=Acrobeloides nanus TaxID=290746 RepID=A0A914EE18_9BILA
MLTIDDGNIPFELERGLTINKNDGDEEQTEVKFPDWSEAVKVAPQADLYALVEVSNTVRLPIDPVDRPKIGHANLLGVFIDLDRKLRMAYGIFLVIVCSCVLFLATLVIIAIHKSGNLSKSALYVLATYSLLNSMVILFILGWYTGPQLILGVIYGF